MTTADRQRQADADNLARGARQGVERLLGEVNSAKRTLKDRHASTPAHCEAARNLEEIENTKLPRAYAYLRECRERAGESL